MEPSYDLGQFTRDEAKAKSRANLRDFIAKAYRGRGDQLKVAFLAGPSIIDYAEIFEPLGVRPENAYGIEMNNEAFALAKIENAKRARPINLFKGTDREFYAQSPQLDVVYLDFLQNYGPAVVSSIDDIMVKHPRLLGKDAILAINMQARRESKKHQNRLEALQTLGAKTINDGYQYFRELYRHFLPALEKRKRDLVPDEIFNLFGEFSALRKNAMMPSLEEDYRHAHRRGLYFEVALRGMFPLLFGRQRNEVRTALADSNITVDSLKPYYLEREGDSLDSMEAIEMIGFVEAHRFFNLMAIKRLKHKNGSEEEPSYDSVLESMIDDFFENRMKGRDVSEYSFDNYSSESGTAMLMQAFRLKQSVLHDVKSKDPRTLARTIGSIEKRKYVAKCLIQKKIKGFRAETIRKLDSACYLLIKDFLSINYSQRLFIDRFEELLKRVKKVREKGYVAPSKQEIAPESEAHIAVNSNPSSAANVQDLPNENAKICSDKEIKSLEETVEEPSLPAALLIEPKTDAQHSRYLSVSDKESIRDLYANGCSPSEIHEALFAGTHVTIGQIRAICAWKTIRNKQETSA